MNGETNGEADVVAGGRFGNAITFASGGNPGEVEVQPSSLLEPAAVTLIAWVRAAGSPGASRTVVGKGGGPGMFATRLGVRGGSPCNAAAYAMDTGSSSGPNPGGLHFYVSSGGRQEAPSVPSATIWNGAWHMVAGTFDGATARFYLDGTEVGAGQSVPGPIQYGQAVGDFTIGDYAAPGTCSPPLSHFVGDVDETRVYSRALSAAEIGRLAAHPGPDPPVLVPDPPAGGGGGAGSAPPEVQSVAPVTPVLRNRPALFTAEVRGEFTRLAWDLTGNSRPEIVSGPNQLSLRFRPRTPLVRVNVQAFGPGGASPVFGTSFAAAVGARLNPFGSRLLAAFKKAPPTYAVGSQFALGPRGLGLPIGQLSCAAFNTTVRAGPLELSGCLRPITSLEDIPVAERAILEEIARRISQGSEEVQVGGFLAQMKRQLNLLDGYVTPPGSEAKVFVNGAKLSARGAASIAAYLQSEVIASANAGLAVGNLNLSNPDKFVLDAGQRGGQVALGTFARAAGGIDSLGGFGLVGDVKVDLLPPDGLTPPAALITAKLKLPEWLKIGGVDFQGEVRLRATTDQGLILEGMRIGPVNANFGALDVQQFQIDYSKTPEGDEWRGQGKACVPSGACLDMVPDAGGVAFLGGDLKFAGATLTPPPPGIPLFPGVNLEHIKFAMGLDPTRIFAGAGVKVASLYDIDGGLVLAFPSDSVPFVFDAKEVGGNFPPSFYGRRHYRTTIGASATAGVTVPVFGRVPLGSGYFLYEYPGYVAFGGGVTQDFFGIVSFDGRLAGELNTDNGRFNISGGVSACIGPLCRGAFGLISSRGLSACLDIGIADTGVGVRFDPFLIVPYVWGCKWSPFAERDVRGAARTAQTGAPYTVRIEANDPSRAVRVEGTGGAPQVRVTGPGGQVLDSTGATGLSEQGGVRILRFETGNMTAVGFSDDAQPGTYQIEPLPGSPPTAGITEAVALPDAKVSARVRGRGARRVLAYNILRRPGQRVTFVEVAADGGARTIGSVNGGGRGTLRFSPAPGRGRRSVEAQLELNGVPAEELNVARFAPPSPRLGRPRRLRVRRRGTSLRVSWARVAGAARYEVVVTPSAGRQRIVRTRGRRARLRGIARSTRGRVTVRAVDQLRSGRPASARFRRTARRKTRFRPLPRVRRQLRR